TDSAKAGFCNVRSTYAPASGNENQLYIPANDALADMASSANDTAQPDRILYRAHAARLASKELVSPLWWDYFWAHLWAAGRSEFWCWCIFRARLQFGGRLGSRLGSWARLRVPWKAGY